MQLVQNILLPWFVTGGRVHVTTNIHLRREMFNMEFFSAEKKEIVLNFNSKTNTNLLEAKNAIKYIPESINTSCALLFACSTHPHHNLKCMLLKSFLQKSTSS